MNTHDPIVGRYVYVQCEGKTYRTYYEENGEGIPLVCLHTAGTDSRQYRHQLCDPTSRKISVSSLSTCLGTASRFRHRIST